VLVPMAVVSSVTMVVVDVVVMVDVAHRFLSATGPGSLITPSSKRSRMTRRRRIATPTAERDRCHGSGSIELGCSSQPGRRAVIVKLWQSKNVDSCADLTQVSWGGGRIVPLPRARCARSEPDRHRLPGGP
jgi:hypothetical protein